MKKRTHTKGTIWIERKEIENTHKLITTKK